MPSGRHLAREPARPSLRPMRLLLFGEHSPQQLWLRAREIPTIFNSARPVNLLLLMCRGDHTARRGRNQRWHDWLSRLQNNAEYRHSSPAAAGEETLLDFCLGSGGILRFSASFKRERSE